MGKSSTTGPFARQTFTIAEAKKQAEGPKRYQPAASDPASVNRKRVMDELDEQRIQRELETDDWDLY